MTISVLVNGEITMHCVEKVPVNTKLVQICESIDTFNKVLILKPTRLGSQISIFKYFVAQTATNWKKLMNIFQADVLGMSCLPLLSCIRSVATFIWASWVSSRLWGACLTHPNLYHCLWLQRSSTRMTSAKNDPKWVTVGMSVGHRLVKKGQELVREINSSVLLRPCPWFRKLTSLTYLRKTFF